MDVRTFADGPVGLQEVWLQVDLKQVASDSLDCVVDGEDVDPLAILHIRTGLNAEGHSRFNTDSLFMQHRSNSLNLCLLLPDDVAQSDPQVVADYPVHANLLIRAGVVRQNDAHSLPPLLPLHEHCVTTEELQLIHLGL